MQDALLVGVFERLGDLQPDAGHALPVGRGPRPARAADDAGAGQNDDEDEPEPDVPEPEGDSAEPARGAPPASFPRKTAMPSNGVVATVGGTWLSNCDPTPAV